MPRIKFKKLEEKLCHSGKVYGCSMTLQAIRDHYFDADRGVLKPTIVCSPSRNWKQSGRRMINHSQLILQSTMFLTRTLSWVYVNRIKQLWLHYL